MRDFSSFSFYDPHTCGRHIECRPGNYIFLLRPGCRLPDIGIGPVVTPIEYRGMRYDVIYTGKASKSLRQRVWETHFNGNNAARSTLRKSLGCLFRYPLIVSGIKRHRRFSAEDEVRLSERMRDSLLLLYALNDRPEALEAELIAELNPPLNLSGNRNPVNKDYRAALSGLRCFVSVPETSCGSSLKERIKTVSRNISFGRGAASPYRVKYGNRDDFDRLVVRCRLNGIEKRYSCAASSLPAGRDSIHFKAEPDNAEGFVVRWQASAAGYMKKC